MLSRWVLRSGWRDEVWQALGEYPARAGRHSGTTNLPDGELDENQAHAPGEVWPGSAGSDYEPRMMDSTTGAAGMRRRQLELHGILFHGDLVQVHVGSGCERVVTNRAV